MGEFDDLIPARKTSKRTAGEFDDLVPKQAGAPSALAQNLAAAGLGNIAPPKRFGETPRITVPERVGPVIDPKASRDRRMARGMAGSVFAEDVPSRTIGELAGDTYDRARIGARGVASGLLEVANAPQHAANLVNTSVNGYAAMLGAQARIPMLPSYDWVRGTQAVIEDESKAIRDKMTPTAIRKAAEFEQADGVIDSVGYLLANPSEGLGFAAEQSPQFLAAGLPGGVTGKLAGAGVFAGGQAGAQVAAENQMRVKRGQITQAEADALTAQAVTTSGVVNTILPRLIPGGTVLEEALSGGKMAGLTRSRGAAIGTLGEGATGGLEEALDQASQNEATGKPLTQGVGKAFALGSLLEAPMGAVAGAMSSGKPATVAPATLGAIARAQADAAQAKTFAEIIGGTPATPADVANDAAIVEAFRARQEVAPEPTGDLDALLAGALPATQPAAPAPVLDIAALERAGVSLGDVVASLTPAAPVPADPSDAGAGVAATPDIDWQAAAEALGLPLEPADGRDNPLAGGDPGGGPATAADRGAVALGDAAGQAGQGGSPARVGGTAVPGDAAGAPAEGVNPDAPGATLTNGFKRGEEPGKRYRVSSSNMGVSLEKRNDESGSASAFFIGKDGALIDGDTIARNNASNVDRLWTPPSDEARVEAESILDEMGKLQLSDPKRAALKDRLRDVVTGKGSSRDNPLPNEREGDAPVGAWVAGPPIPGATPDQTVRQIMEVPIEQIDATEFDSAGNIAPEKRADAERYTEAMRAGDQFPNGRASELPNGKIKLQDGHRRYAAAKASGAKTMRLAVSPMPAGTQAPAVDATTMQNRDRSRAASVSQMQDIRRNPDPERLGFSRDPNTGAPMVGAGKPIPDTDKGRADTVVMASGRRVPVQYAVVEADELAASHDADGRANPGYDAAPLKALNNGRTAGLQAAYASGNTDAYRQGISADAGLHGVSAEAIAGKRNPVLVRLYDPAQNTGDMGAESNATQQLGLSPVEQAQTDARALPDLAGMTWNEDGSISPTGNANFFRAWFANMGDTQAASLQDAQGRPNAAALQRVRGAMVQRAFGDERLLTAMAEEIDPDNRNVMNALVRAAPGFAALDNTEHSRDVKAAMVGGLELLRDAKARGISLRDAIAQGDLLGRNADADAVAAFMADNARSAKRMAEAFKVVAEYAARAETQAATLDVFGAAPQPTVAGALGEAGITENRYGTETGRDDLAVAEGTGSRQPAEVAGAPAGDAFGLQAPAAPAAAQEVAPAPSAGLFGAPSARDYIDAAGRARDARRNGDPGADSRMLAGDGELFAGARPEQASVPARLPGTDAVAQRQVNAENRFLDFAMETGGLTREQATAAMAEYRKAKAIKFDVVGGGFTFTNGGFAERDVLRRAAGLESPKQARRPRNPDTDEVIGVGMLHPTKSSRGRWMFHVYLRDSEGREYDHQVHAHTKAGGYDLQGGYSERIGQQPGTDEPLASVEPAERDANFNRWSKGAPIIEPDEMWTGYEGGPAVFRLFHGTTADFDAFDRSRANPESDFGAGFYFSNTPDDVGNNYAGIGPDLTQKIEREAERIAQETDRDYSDPEVVAEARAKWVQHDGATMPVFVRMLNPAIVGGDNETRLTYEEEYDEEADEYGEPGGTLVDFIEALRYEAGNFSDGDVEAGIAALFDFGIDGDIALSDVIAKLKAVEEFAYYTDDYGNMASSEIIRAALERAGFDGIVDYTVDAKFGSQKRIGKAMAGMSEDTVHVIAFEPTQIKSSTGNSGEFNPSNHSVLAQTETLTDADLTPAEFASMQRQSIDRKALREKLSREQGEADADANGLREAVNKVVRKAGKVVYLRGMDGLPDEVRGPLDRAAAQRGANMRTAGLFDPSTGTTYLFTDVLKSPQLAAFTAAHEIAGHQGLRALLGADLNTVLDLAEQNPTVRKVAASMTKQRNLRPDQRYLAIEEALADLAAANATGNWTRIEEKHGVKAPLEMRNKFAAMLANVVRKLKALFKARSVGFSDAQVRQLLENARKAAEGKGASYTVANADGTLEQVVFHGTPHTVDRFSLQKIGTGEGAQAYGWGMYFASHQGVAESYRTRLTREDDARMAQSAARDEAKYWAKHKGSDEEAIKYLAERESDYTALGDYSRANKFRDAVRWLRDGRPELDTVARRGNTYRVDVPEDSDLLDWDKPLSEQPEKVRAALAAADFNGDQVVAAWKTNGAWEHVTAKQLYLRVADDPNPNALSQAGARSGGHKAASEYFNSIGIPGLRYLDGTSRTKGEGSANYVIWDESAIGQPQSALESTEDQTQSEAFRRWFGKSEVVDADGKPLVVYHGTHDDFDVFAPNPSLGGAMFFSPDPAEASSFAFARGANVMPVYLRAEKVWPKIVRSYDEVATFTKARAAGYDAVRVRDSADGAINWAVFDPSQIKSATANNGNFDPTSDSILESVEEVEPFDAATATGASVIRDGRLLSLIDAVKAAGGDMAAIRAAIQAQSVDALTRAIDGALAAMRPKPRVTGTKNAVTDAERMAAGRDPILREAVQSNEETVVRAMRELKDDPTAGDEAVARLSRDGVESISVADEAILLVHKTDLLNKREAAAKKLADPNASEATKDAARQAWAEAEAKIAQLDLAASNAGREWGRFGQFRQRMMAEDFSLVALERKERARLERPLTPEESATIKAMAEQIAALQKKVEALQERAKNSESEWAYEAMTRRVDRPKRAQDAISSLRQRADEARRRLRATPGVQSRNRQSGAVISPQVFADLATIGAYHVANGAAKLVDWVDAMRADVGDWFDGLKADHSNIFTAAKREAEQPPTADKFDATPAEVLEKIDLGNIGPKDVRKLIAAHVGAGLRGEVAVIEAAANDLGLAEDEVRALFIQSVPRTEQSLTEAKQELADLRKLVRLQAEIDRLEAGLPAPTPGRPRVDSPAVAQRKQELADLRKSMRPVRDPEGRYQEMRGKQIAKRITELQARIAAGDFATRPRVPRALSDANQRAMFELDKAKESFLRHQFEDTLRKRTPLGKAFGLVGDTFNLARAVMTSFDLSAILRQGGFIAYGHPLRAVSSIGPSLKAFVSEASEHALNTEIMARKNAPLYKKYGLQLTGIGAGPLTQIEEAYASRWLSKLPWWTGGGLVRGSGRSYTAFLNKLRADSFDAMVATLALRSVPTEAEGKAIASYINVATGRGKVGMKEQSAQALNTVFFAPRLVASRFQLLAGQPLYGGSARTRKLVAQEYARFAIGVSVVLALTAFAVGGDDDDSDKPLIGLDPRSADFLKIRTGNTYIDPMAGLAQVSTFIARMATGETVTGKGEVKPLRTGYTLTDLRRALGSDAKPHEYEKDGSLPFGSGSAADVLGRFLRTKLAPVPGAIVTVLSGSNAIGDPVTPATAAGEMVTPMSFQNIAEVMEEQGIPKGTAVTTLGMLGMGIQHRTQSNAQAFADFTDGLDSVRSDVKDRLKAVPVEQWPETMEALRKEYGPAMEGLELQIYKRDAKYGAAGEPQRDADGNPKLKSNRIADNYREASAAADDEQAHHVIPDNLARHHPLMAQARSIGYDLDHAGNLLNMPKKSGGDEIAHRTSHPGYDAEVFALLETAEKRLKKLHGSLKDAPKPAVLDAVRKVEAEMRERIQRKDVPTKDGRLALNDDEARGAA